MTRRLLALAAVAVLLLAGLSLAAGEWLTRPARARFGAPPAGLSARPVRIPYGDGQQVSGWFQPGCAGQGAMLLLHGVHSNRQQMVARAQWLRQAGIASLALDLPAHGESSGDRISFGRREALGVQAALGWLRAQQPGERVGAIGVSLGGASLLFADRQPELDALVLESVFPTIVDAVNDRLTTRLGPAGGWLSPLLLVQLPLRLGLSTDQLRPIDAIAAVHAPVFIAAGTADRSTRWPETEQLFAAAPAPKTLWAVPGAGHVDLHDADPAAYEARLGPWLQQQLRQYPASPTCPTRHDASP